jgi:hypothetical protein
MSKDDDSMRGEPSPDRAMHAQDADRATLPELRRDGRPYPHAGAQGRFTEGPIAMTVAIFAVAVAVAAAAMLWLGS